MELIINIPEDIYKASQIIDVKYEDVIQIPLEVIKNGTPLPKGHGRLIDADALNLDYEVEMADDWKTAHEIANCVKYAPTIIDKEE